MGFDLNVSIPVLTVFAQGLLSFFSPCVFPLIPLYISYLSGGTGTRDTEGNWHYPRSRVMVHTVFFLLGISMTFFILGLGFSAAGGFFRDYQTVFARVGGVLVILLGLYQLGIFGTSRLLGNEHRLPFHMDRMAMSPLTAFVMGFFFSFSWTPCVGPALSGVLLMTASAGTRARGFLMIGVYTVGFVLPFLAVGLFTSSLVKLFRRHAGIVRYTARIGAVLLIFMGIWMCFGTVSAGALSGKVQQEADSGKEKQDQKEQSDAENREDTGDSSGEDKEEQGQVDFTLTDQYGTSHSLSDYRGKVVFLNFWATWCGPCRMEMPDIQKLYEEYQAQGEVAGAVILSVAAPELGNEGSREDIIKYMEDNGYTYPVLMDTQAEVSAKFGISAYPTTFMIDREGVVFGYVSGALELEQMESIIRQTMDGKTESYE